MDNNRNLRPGGYVEMQDINVLFGCDDGSVRQGCAISRWTNLLIKAGNMLNRPIDVAKDHKARMEAAGSVDVEIICKWPQNQWPRDREMKEIGIWTMVNTQQGMQTLPLAALIKGLGWTPEEVEALLIDLRKDVRDISMHIYWPM